MTDEYITGLVDDLYNAAIKLEERDDLDEAMIELVRRVKLIVEEYRS